MLNNGGKLLVGRCMLKRIKIQVCYCLEKLYKYRSVLLQSWCCCYVQLAPSGVEGNLVVAYPLGDHPSYAPTQTTAGYY